MKKNNNLKIIFKLRKNLVSKSFYNKIKIIDKLKKYYLKKNINSLYNKLVCSKCKQYSLKSIFLNIYCSCKKSIKFKNFFYHLKINKFCLTHFQFKNLKISQNLRNYIKLQNFTDEDFNLFLNNAKSFCFQIDKRLLLNYICLILSSRSDFKVCIAGKNYKQKLKKINYPLVIIDFRSHNFDIYENIMKSYFIVLYLK